MAERRFLARCMYDGLHGEITIPGRIMVHPSGILFIKEFGFDDLVPILKDIHGTLTDEDNLSLLKTNPKTGYGTDYFLGLVWNNNGVFDLEISCYSDTRNWNVGAWQRSNPDEKRHYFRDGEPVSVGNELYCSDGNVFFGSEEIFRRTTGDLEDYMSTPAHLGKMEPKCFRTVRLLADNTLKR